MSVYCPHRNARAGVAFTGRSGIFDRFLLGLVVVTLLRAGAALAADAPEATSPLDLPHSAHASTAVSASAFNGSIFTKPYTGRLLSDPLLTAPGLYQLPELAEPNTYSSKDFRPRGRSVFDTYARNGGQDNRPSDQALWISQFRNRDRIRVLTLWESGASAVSIQTDRKGDPSLQWTSRLFNRGGATHGLLDRLFPVSVFNGTERVTRSATVQTSKASGALSALHFGSSTPPP
jgi:hypothetical protein